MPMRREKSLHVCRDDWLKDLSRRGHKIGGGRGNGRKSQCVSLPPEKGEKMKGKDGEFRERLALKMDETMTAGRRKESL